MEDKWAHITGCWQAWITGPAARHNAEEVQRRLAQILEHMREQVRSHARTVWRLTSATTGTKQHRR